MILRLCLCVLLLAGLAGCNTPGKHSAPEAKKAAEEKKKPKNTAPDASGDVNFQAFVGRLRKAVEMHDDQALAGMMTSNFGWRLDPLGEGDGVFQYWDENMLWPQLQAVVNQRFVPFGNDADGNFMVAPPEFAKAPQAYHGYRAGIQSINGAWKFAYFVTD